MRQAAPLFRGNDDDVAGRPDPRADSSVLLHVRYTGGPARRTPYLSTSEQRADAERFGLLWQTTQARIHTTRAVHIPHDQLLARLRRAPADREADRLIAIARVKRHAEHLIDYRKLRDEGAAATAVALAFERST